jgi:outer membrane protein assembly factor BamB
MLPLSRLFASLVPLTALVSGLSDGNRLLAGDWPQWRGPNRDAVSTEKGLLQDWKETPRLAWRASGLGAGYSSVVVSNGLVFTIGKHGQDVFAFALEADTGKVRWSRKIGTTSRNTMSTPTVDEDRIYAVDPDGDLVCLKSDSGETLWQLSYPTDFGGTLQSGRGYGESPLVDGERLICTPGGPEAMIVALDKRTGKTEWKAAIPTLGEAGADGAGFSSIVISEAAGVRQYVQLVGRGLIGVDANSGKFLWGFNQIANLRANIPTPIVYKDLVFAANGYHAGSACLKLTADGKGGVSAEEVYSLSGSRFQNHHGGIIRVGEHIFGGHGSNNGLPTCVELETGKVVWKRRGPGTGSAAVVYADGHVYFRYQNGLVALIEANNKAYRLKGTFQIPSAGGDSWSHPVVASGRLFLREKDHLFVYDIRSQGAASASVAGSASGTDIAPQPFATASRFKVPRMQRLFRHLTASDRNSAVVVTLSDKQLEEDGALDKLVVEELQALPKPLLLDVAGTSISDDGIEQIANLSNLVGLNLELCGDITDGSLQHLSGAPGLRVLLLTGTAITNTGLQHLEPIKNLVALDLEVCDGVSETGCASLAKMQGLRTLVLKKTGFERDRVTDAGLKQLSGLTELETLDLYGNSVTDAGLAHLRLMQSLRELDLSLLPVTDDGLPHLTALSKLEHLDLLYSEGFGGVLITDKGIASLAKLTNLKSLNLVGAKITDDGLGNLTTLKRLRQLRIVNTGVTHDGAKRFQAAVPNCQVTR